VTVLDKNEYCRETDEYEEDLLFPREFATPMTFGELRGSLMVPPGFQVSETRRQQDKASTWMRETDVVMILGSKDARVFDTRRISGNLDELKSHTRRRPCIKDSRNVTYKPCT